MTTQSKNLLHQQGQSFPSINVPVVDADGHISLPWYQFFLFLWNNTQRGYVNPHEEDVGPSPWTYTMDISGEFLIFGGTVQLITFSRDGVNFYNTGVTQGAVSGAVGDLITITYTDAPRVLHVPM